MDLTIHLQPPHLVAHHKVANFILNLIMKIQTQKGKEGRTYV